MNNMTLRTETSSLSAINHTVTNSTPHYDFPTVANPQNIQTHSNPTVATTPLPTVRNPNPQQHLLPLLHSSFHIFTAAAVDLCLTSNSPIHQIIIRSKWPHRSWY